MNTYISWYVDWEEILSQRTLNALNRAWIFYAWEFISYIWDHTVDMVLWEMKGMGKKWIKECKEYHEYVLKNFPDALTTTEDHNDLESVIDRNVLDSKLSFYSSRVGLRTINALNNISIYTIHDLLKIHKKRDAFFLSIKWFWKKSLSEIRDLVLYIYSLKKDELSEETEYDIRELLSNQRLTDALIFNWVDSLGQLKEYMTDFKIFSSLRYLNREDYDYIKSKIDWIAINNTHHQEWIVKEMKVFLNNLTQDEKEIFNSRIISDLTLVEVWQKLWVTRERVRQKQKILSSKLSAFCKTYLSKNPLVNSRIEEIFDLYGFIFMPDQVKLFDFLWIEDNAIHYLSLLFTSLSDFKIVELSDKKLCIFKDTVFFKKKQLDNLYWYVLSKLNVSNQSFSIDDFFYEIISDDAFNKRKVFYVDWRWRNAKKRFNEWASITSDLLIENKELILSFIKSLITLHEDYVLDWDSINRIIKRYPLVYMVEMILSRNLDWLHFSDIALFIKEEYWEEFSNVRIHRLLSNESSKFINIWLWLYALKTNKKFSWEKTGDLIYLYLNKVGVPKAMNEITTYVLSRKKVNWTTVKAAINSYENETRFVRYKDWKVWLKEWGLSNVRSKRKIKRYAFSVPKAIDIVFAEDELPLKFSVDEFIVFLKKRFNDKVSDNRNAISAILLKKKRIWELGSVVSGHKNIYFLNK